jgi:hypothetical protein
MDVGNRFGVRVISMSLTLPADAGEPMPTILIAGPKVARHEFPAATRQISLRNTGTNTLWVSFDCRSWVDIACGTSLDDRVIVRELWHCTQVGRTRFVVIGLALMSMDAEHSERDDDENRKSRVSLKSRTLPQKRRWLPSRSSQNRR